MSQGSVTVNNLNLGQGSFPEVERKALFIGESDLVSDVVLSINSQSNLDDILGINDSPIKTQLKAAQLNGGENWQAYAYTMAEELQWLDIITDVIIDVSVELIIACNPVTGTKSIEDAQIIAEQIRTTYAKRVIVLQAFRGLADDESWDQYINFISPEIANISGYRVAAIPLIHGNDLGALAGRLCNRSVSIADSPMRVATGSVLGLGNAVLDAEEKTISDAQLATLDGNRFTVIQRYVDYAGVYFGSCTLLDEPAGDFQVIENLRVVDKAARAIRILAIKKIKDRSVNTTALSQAFTKNYLMRPLREMSKGAQINGIPFPSEIKPPKDDAIALIWTTSERLEVYLKLTPYASPREIVANIFLDLSTL